jgi:hypothetical protein
MPRTKIMALLLMAAVPILAACAGASAAAQPLSPDDGVEAIQLIGCDVNSLAGTWLGEVAGVLTDADTGEIDYVVLSFEEPRVYGIALMATDPRRFVPVPWAQFKPDPEGGALIADADEMSLIPAPYLEEAPASLNLEQAQAIDDYWQSLGDKGN